MKTNKYFFIVIGFLSVIIVGISMIGLLAFTSAATPASDGVSPITATDANRYFKNYMANSTATNQVIKGFTVDKSQLDAMNRIAQENPNLTGFRVYFGFDSNSRKIAIVVGVDNSGKDAVTTTIYNTASQNTNPCPPICDITSTITKQ